MKQQRAVIALLLVGVFIFNMLGYCMFSVLILTHQKSVFNQIISGEFEKKELCILNGADIKNVKWEHEKEFEWKGEMYDVVKKESKNGNITYTCKKDTKEDQLKGQKRKAAEKSASRKMVEMVKIFVQATSANQPSFILGIQKTEIGIYVKDYSFSFSSIYTPPPKG